ncbi:MAG: hypothetical protein H0T53_15075 [Herpetosiphonaceae bacterium]|nr:hypothetical protein [Herpetosiphonaceae bacterium]
MTFRDDPTTIVLHDFRLHLGERFWYEYNFHANWIHDLRLEAILPLEAAPVPRCVAGARAAPPEDCGGPWAFLALRQAHLPGAILQRFATLYTGSAEDREQLRAEWPALRYWLGVDRFDRRRVNRRLHQYAIGDDRWEWPDE